MSVFSTPASPGRRRRHKRHGGSIAARPIPELERLMIDAAISATWGECYRQGCPQAAWEAAGLIDACLRYRRHFIGVVA